MMPSPQTVMVQPAPRVRGHVRPPGDKAISHRYALLAALADGRSEIRGYSTGGDCASTLRCLRGLGVSIEETRRDASGLTLIIDGRGLGGLSAPPEVLDAGNSGSTMRMLAGILAAHPFQATMTGDDSLRRRPMRRVIVPLERMGARIGSEEGRPPLSIQGVAPLQPIEFSPEVPSAQVKTAVLLAGLHASGVTTVHEPLATRDHTERALQAFGVRVETRRTFCISERRPTPQRAHPGGSRRYFLGGILDGRRGVAFGLGDRYSFSGCESHADRHHRRAEAHRGGHSRRGRRRWRGRAHWHDQGAARPSGSVEIAPAEVPGVIDELPVLGALATHGGELRVTGAQELRVKESDRISALADGLRRMGGDIDELPDGFHVRGTRRLRGGEVDARNDHRLAMAFAIAALGASGPTVIADAGAAAVSYPEFFAVLESLRA